MAPRAPALRSDEALAGPVPESSRLPPKPRVMVTRAWAAGDWGTVSSTQAASETLATDSGERASRRPALRPGSPLPPPMSRGVRRQRLSSSPLYSENMRPGLAHFRYPGNRLNWPRKRSSLRFTNPTVGQLCHQNPQTLGPRGPTARGAHGPCAPREPARTVLVGAPGGGAQLCDWATPRPATPAVSSTLLGPSQSFAASSGMELLMAPGSAQRTSRAKHMAGRQSSAFPHCRTVTRSSLCGATSP